MMKQKKFYFMIPAVFLIFLVNVAVVLGFFYFIVFRYTDDSSLAKIDSDYQDAIVLDETYDVSSGCKYIFFKEASGGFRIVVLEKSPFYDRYRYVPKCTVQISEERPYSEVIDVPNNKTQITINESDEISYLNISGTFPRQSTTLQTFIILLLCVVECVIFGLVWRLCRKK